MCAKIWFSSNKLAQFDNWVGMAFAGDSGCSWFVGDWALSWVSKVVEVLVVVVIVDTWEKMVRHLGAWDMESLSRWGWTEFIRWSCEEGGWQVTNMSMPLCKSWNYNAKNNVAKVIGTYWFFIFILWYPWLKFLSVFFIIIIELFKKILKII